MFSIDSDPQIGVDSKKRTFWGITLPVLAALAFSACGGDDSRNGPVPQPEKTTAVSGQSEGSLVENQDEIEIDGVEYNPDGTASYFVYNGFNSESVKVGATCVGATLNLASTPAPQAATLEVIPNFLGCADDGMLTAGELTDLNPIEVVGK